MLRAQWSIGEMKDDDKKEREDKKAGKGTGRLTWGLFPDENI